MEGFPRQSNGVPIKLECSITVFAYGVDFIVARIPTLLQKYSPFSPPLSHFLFLVAAMWNMPYLGPLFFLHCGGLLCELQGFEWNITSPSYYKINKSTLLLFIYFTRILIYNHYLVIGSLTTHLKMMFLGNLEEPSQL